MLTNEIKDLLYQLYDKELALKHAKNDVRFENIRLPVWKQNLIAERNTVQLQIEIKNIKKELIKNDYGERKSTS